MLTTATITGNIRRIMVTSSVQQVLPPALTELVEFGLPRTHDLVDRRPRVDHGPQPRGAGELVDVVVRAPREDARVELLAGHDHGHRGANGLEPALVGDVHLHATARLADELRERGR